MGHSDADVIVHAIIDALFGALALRDIGYHFPDSDEKYKNANSILLLKEANRLILNEGYEIVNIDSNIICQKPKLLNYIEQMRENLAQALGVELSQISIKAKTNEKMDSMGQEQSIVSNAVVLLRKIRLS